MWERDVGRVGKEREMWERERQRDVRRGEGGERDIYF